MPINQAPKNGDLRVWWVPQIPMKAFHVPVADVEQAKLILKALADYDLFQFANNIKPDYSNAGGLEMCRDGEWEEWYSDNDECIDDLLEQS